MYDLNHTAPNSKYTQFCIFCSDLKNIIHWIWTEINLNCLKIVTWKFQIYFEAPVNPVEDYSCYNQKLGRQNRRAQTVLTASTGRWCVYIVYKNMHLCNTWNEFHLNINYSLRQKNTLTSSNSSVILRMISAFCIFLNISILTVPGYRTILALNKIHSFFFYSAKTYTQSNTFL